MKTRTASATAWHRLVDRHLGLAISAARKRGGDEDLEAEATAALCLAAAGWTGPEEGFPRCAAGAIHRAVISHLRASQVGTQWRARTQQDGRRALDEVQRLAGGDGFTSSELHWLAGGAVSEPVRMVSLDEASRVPAAQDGMAGAWESLSLADRALVDEAVSLGGTGGVSLTQLALAVVEDRATVEHRLGAALRQLTG